MIPVAVVLLALTGPPTAASSDSSIEFREDRAKIVKVSMDIPDGWSVLYDWDAPAEIDLIEIDGGKRVVVDGPPGTYDLEAAAILARYDETTKRVEFDKRVWRVELVITPSQKPRPPPKPDDPDVPDPTTGRLESVLILRSSTDTPQERLELATIRQSPIFEAGKPNLMILDREAETPEGRPDPLLSKYKPPGGAGFPYFFAVDGKGAVIQQGEFAPQFEETIRGMLR